MVVGNRRGRTSDKAVTLDVSASAVGYRGNGFIYI